MIEVKRPKMNTVVSSHLLFMTLITTWFKNKHYALSVSSGFHMFSSLSIAISYTAVVWTATRSWRHLKEGSRKGSTCRFVCQKDFKVETFDHFGPLMDNATGKYRLKYQDSPYLVDTSINGWWDGIIAHTHTYTSSNDKHMTCKHP